MKILSETLVERWLSQIMSHYEKENGLSLFKAKYLNNSFKFTI